MLLPNRFLGASSGILVIQVVCDRPTSCSARLTLWLPFLQQEEGSREQEEEEAEEEKRVILVAGVRVQEGDGGRVPAAASDGRCVWTEATPFSSVQVSVLSRSWGGPGS